MSWSKSFLFVLILSAAAFAARQSGSDVDTSEWGSYRNQSMGFKVKYPKDWRIQQPTGTGPESVLLNEPRQAGKENLTIQFWVQRNINPKRMSIQQWYAFQLLGDKSAPAALTSLDGRTTIRREIAGTLGRNFDFFTALNDTDVFEVTISQPLDQTQFNPAYAAILSTIGFLN